MRHYLRQARDHGVTAHDANHGRRGAHRARGGEDARAGIGAAASTDRGHPAGVLGACRPRSRIQDWSSAAHRLRGGDQALFSRKHRLSRPLVGQGNSGFIGDIAHRLRGSGKLFCKGARGAGQAQIAEHHRTAFRGKDMSGTSPAKANGHVCLYGFGCGHAGIGVNARRNVHR